MRRQSRGGGYQGDEILGHILRLDGAETEMVKLCLVQDSLHHHRQIATWATWREIASVASEIDAAQNDFLRACRHEFPDFGDHGIGRKAPAASPYKWNHAISAAIVA